MGKMSSGMRLLAMTRAQGSNQGNNMAYGSHTTMANAPEMRRRRDSRGRYMEDDGGSRMAYDGNQGNYGRMEQGGASSHYWPEPHMPPYLDGAENNLRPGEHRRGYDEPVSMRDRNVVNIRDYQDKRLIGFGAAEMHDADHRASHDKEMRHGSSDHASEPLTEDRAKSWVEGMKNADPDHPTGAKWSMETVKPLATKHGFNTPEKQLEFWAVMNMMYSDYSETAKKHNVSTMEFYADMAKSWLRDKDAVEHKTAAYIDCCTK